MSSTFHILRCFNFKIYICLCCAIISCEGSMNLCAQEYVFKQISTQHGLSQNDVNCIFQDQQGFMWFGTADGLNRYDGYEFKTFSYQVDQSNGLTSNIIQTIAQDQNQNIWIGTGEGGVNIIDYHDENIRLPVALKNQSCLLANKYVGNIAMLNNLVIVMGKESICFFKMEGEKCEHVMVNNKASLQNGAKFTNCYQLISDSTLLIGTKQGLRILNFKWAANGIQASVSSKLLNYNVYELEPFRDGHLVYCLHDSLYFMDAELSLSPILKERINCMLVEGDTNVWLGTHAGLKYLSFKNDSSLKVTSTVIYDYHNSKEAIASNVVRRIFKDKSGMIWLSTKSGGLTMMDKRSTKFDLYPSHMHPENHLRISATCFLEDSQQKLWIGKSDGTITIYPPQNLNFETGGVEVLNLDFPHSIRLLKEVKIGDYSYIIAANNYSTRLKVLDLNGKILTEAPNIDFLHSAQLNRPINTILQDEDYLWIGTYEGGLYRHHLGKNQTKCFLTQNTKSLCSNLIDALCLDSAGNLLIGTNKGLNVLLRDEKNKMQPKFQQFTHANSSKDSLSFNHITSIIKHSNQEIWIGTMGGGLNRFNYDQKTFSCVSTHDGLPSNSVKGIIEDDNQNIWIASNNGLSLLNVENFDITNFNPSDGLQDNEFKMRAYCKLKNGTLIFGGSNGFNTFCPTLMQQDTATAKIELTAMVLPAKDKKEEVYHNRAKLFRHVTDVTPIQLKHTQNSFTIYFSSLNFFTPNTVEYKYRLAGFDAGWSNTYNHTRFAKYTNLQPGEYTFEVIATNDDGIWMQKPLQLHLKISKAWYETYLAYAFYTLIVFAIFIVFTRFSLMRNNIKNNLLMERFEREKVNQLTQYKLRFFTNISHELRTPITIIKNYFEDIAPNWQQMTKEKINNDILVITRNINSLHRLVSQLLYFRKMEQENVELSPDKHDIVQFLSEVMSSFQLLAENKKIELSLKCPFKVLEFWFDKDKMEIILNNILSNAFKYTPEGGMITVRLNESEEEVKIEIEDTGNGIPLSIQNHIFERYYMGSTPNNTMGNTGIGLNLTKGLVELHKGRIELRSIEGVGSCFMLFFQKGFNHLKENKHQKLENQNVTVEIGEPADQVNPSEIPLESYKGKSVLVVEDNVDLCTFLTQKLQGEFKVYSAANGKEGLEICLEHMPDIVVSDIMMPQMNGYELCDAIKNNETISHIPVILLTAKVNEESELQGFKLGADAYVGKPFNIDILIARVIAILYSRQKVWQRIGENPFFSASEVTFTAKDEQFLGNITNLIETHMSNPNFSVEQLAEYYSISTLNLNKKIKALTGKTSVQFIRLTRLRKAAELLKAGHNRVSDVTYDVGYSDLQHFRTHFKKEFSITPSQFKNKYAPLKL